MNHSYNRIVVNADDFGRNESMSMAILECFRNNWITQATVMVNMPYADEAVARAKVAGVDGRIGLHLNLTEGKPLTQSIKNYSAVCDKNGQFFVHKAGINGLRPFDSDDFRRAVIEELRAQIEKYCSYGLPMMHCDGHHHVHNRLQFAYDVLPLLKEYGFKSVRNHYTPFLKCFFLTRKPISYMYGKFQHRIFMRLVRENDLLTTDGFGGWQGGSLDKWRKFNSFEIMVHPDYDERGEIVNVINYASKTGPAMAELKKAMDKLSGQL